MNDAIDPTAQDSGERLLERHLQYYVAKNIGKVLGRPAIKLLGTEVPTPAGRIDILAVDPEGRPWVIETKFGTATRDAVAQLQSYMAAVPETPGFSGMEAIGILIAEDFDSQCKYALRAVNRIQAMRYSIAFNTAYATDLGSAVRPTSLNEPWVIDIDDGVVYPQGIRRAAISLTNRFRVEEVLADNDFQLKAGVHLAGRYRRVDD